MRSRKLALLLALAVALSVSVGVPALAYTVNISSYDAFRAAVLGNWYDVDGQYGAQCWDGAALLWQQLGRGLYTGGRNAVGTWIMGRDVNAGDDFYLITSIRDVKRGDVVVFDNNGINFNAIDDNGDSCGHIAFADNDYNPSIGFNIMGQNQEGNAAFSVSYSVNVSSFVGAFRLKRWEAPTTASLDINGSLDGIASGNTNDYGCFDLYLNDVLQAPGLFDYYNATLPIGTRYRIENVTPIHDTHYLGVTTGALSGTVTAGGVNVTLAFSTLPDNQLVTLYADDGMALQMLGWQSVVKAAPIETRQKLREWNLQRNSDGSFRVLNVDNENRVFTASEKGDTWSLQAYDSEKASYQRWAIRLNGGKAYFSPLSAPSKCAVVDSDGKMVLETYTGAQSQLYTLQTLENGYEPEKIDIPSYLYLKTGWSALLEPEFTPSYTGEAYRGVRFFTDISGLGKYYAYPRSNVVDIDGDTGVIVAQNAGIQNICAQSTYDYSDLKDYCMVIVPNLPDELKVVGEEAFVGSGMYEIILPPGCTTIEKRAFAGLYHCAIVIPPSVTSIAEDAFEDCVRTNNGIATSYIFTFEGSEADRLLTEYGVKHYAWTETGYKFK